jgi:hypothetical protein
MKKSIFTFALGIFLQLTYAQDIPQLPTSIIVTGGLNLASLAYNDYFLATDVNPGFSGGAMLRTDGDIFVLTGLQYVQANPTMADKANVQSDKVSLQFLQLPLMFGIHILKSPDYKRTLHAQLGASLSTLLSVSSNSLGISKETINNTVFNFKLGIGTDLGRFTVDINYNMLISHLYNVAGYNNRAKLKCFEFMVGYKINLGKKGED